VAAHADALRQAGTAGAGTALDSVAECYAQLGLALYAAEAAAQACRAHQSMGQGRRAAASAARGYFLLGSGDDGPPPLALALALTPPELTRREREVATLAARGLPSPAIANRLCLSVRTVETHLARVYLKLGITSRAELGAALVSAASGSGRVETG
jgi:DNA-binding NarL/FixJ family response regulator